MPVLSERNNYGEEKIKKQVAIERSKTVSKVFVRPAAAKIPLKRLFRRLRRRKSLFKMGLVAFIATRKK
ncbi:MAG: hypothetical protein WA004_04450 [Saprospiraceae bacterium]